MTARSPRDLIDYIDDDTQDEDETLFFPTPSDASGSWSAFYGGILIGVAGGALIPLAPWLGGAMVFAGYGMTALSFLGSRSRLGRALRFGFAIVALTGAALLLGAIFVPDVAWSAVTAAAQRHLIFLTTAFSAWAIALVKYVIAILAR